MDSNGETLRKSTLFNIQQQAIRHSKYPHIAVAEPRGVKLTYGLLADSVNNGANKEVIVEWPEARRQRKSDIQG